MSATVVARVSARQPVSGPAEAWPSAPPRGSSPIVMPRSAALVASVLALGLTLSVAALAVLPGVPFIQVLPATVPALVAAAAVGVDRLTSWAPRLWAEWRGWFGYLTLAPWLLLLAVSAVDPHLALPTWLAAVCAAIVPLPLLWSALAPHRLRARTRPAPDAHGRRGGLWSAAALGLAAYAVADTPAGVALQLGLPVVLVVASLRPRGLADAGATWRARQWLALVWGGAVVCATVVGVHLGLLPAPWTPASAAVAAGVPLALASGIRPDPRQ